MSESPDFNRYAKAIWLLGERIDPFGGTTCPSALRVGHNVPRNYAFLIYGDVPINRLAVIDWPHPCTHTRVANEHVGNPLRESESTNYGGAAFGTQA